jgi:NAD(P)-dependent dehydrogenase (short-subunit alcohol dehydrogenase family)
MVFRRARSRFWALLPLRKAVRRRITNLGSWVARLSVPVGALYASTKGAMETLTRAWAAEFWPRVIRDPAVYAGTDHPAAAMAGIPAGRPGNPDDVAAAMVYRALAVAEPLPRRLGYWQVSAKMYLRCTCSGEDSG